LDTSLTALGLLVALSLASGVAWHMAVKSYALAVGGSVFTIVVLTYFIYPIYRGVPAGPLMLADSAILAGLIAFGVRFAFKRSRVGKQE
jgi:hypothetical protein